MKQRLRIFVSSPGDVSAAREIAALTIERLAQDYARFLIIEPYLWEFEAMVASGHFQDSIEPPSAFDVVVLILWSRLGTHLPERTSVREYRGMDGRTPLTGTEWEFEEAMQAAKQTGAPDLLVYRNLSPAPFDTHDPRRFEQQSLQLKALNGFWERHFANQGMFIGAYTSFTRDTEFASALEHHLRKLIERRVATIGAGTGDDITAKVWMQAPFRGLEAYEFEHAPIFFGQDEALAKAMLQLTANAEAGSPFLLVLGASGSGKSSLVKAGIVPKLLVPRRIAGNAFLRRVVFRPSDAIEGEDLFDALARRLTTQLSEQEGLSELIGQGQTVVSLAAHLRNATAAPAYPIETALGQLASAARKSGRMLDYETAKLVLVVDQLEELFTVDRTSPSDRVRFIELLAGLVGSGLVWVIATMRRDFWHRAEETPELVRRSNGNRRLELLPATPSQLTQMIRRPAEAAGINFEVHPTTTVPLNEIIAEEVAREPGALPLLSYLLHQLYRADVLDGQGNALTYATYERLGKLEGAIATQAEAVLERCIPEDRAALGSVLFSLVDMGAAEGSVERAVARRVPLAAFPPGTARRRLVDALLDPGARLLVSDTEKEGNPAVRVAHEALISQWTQAREFVQSNAQALKIRHRIEERYVLWSGLQEVGHGAASAERENSAARSARSSLWRSGALREHGLLTDIDLTDGQRLLNEHHSDTEHHLVAYIERSIAESQRIRTRSVRALAAVAVVVTVLAIVASLAGWVASKKAQEAEYQASETLKAQSRMLIEAAAQRLKDSDVARARGIILEVLTNPRFAQGYTPDAISVFQEVRAADNQLIALSGHTERIYSMAYSRTGDRIVTGSYDKSARIWDGSTGAPLAVLVGHQAAVNCATYSPDDARIVTASNDNTARIWDARTHALQTVLSGHTDAVNCAAYSPDGARIVTASSDNTARIWDARTSTQLTVISGHSAPVETATYSSDGSRIVTASDDKTARTWDARTGKALAVLSGHNDIVLSAAYSPDATRIVTASTDKTARIWDARTGAQLAVLSGGGADVYSAAYSPDGSRIATASDDGAIRIWESRSASLEAILRSTDDINYRIVFSPDGTRIAAASSFGRVWDAQASVPLGILSGHKEAVYSAAYSPDGKYIVTASYDQTARIWDARTGVPLAVLSGHSAAVNFASYSSDGLRIVTASNDKTARIWDARSGEQLSLLIGHGDHVVSAAYSPDGTRILTASDDKTARIWDAGTGKELFVLSGHSGEVSHAAYSTDGARVVTASSDMTARIWDAHTGAQLAVLAGHTGGLFYASYSPDSARVVTASQDKTARIWDARTFRQLAVLSGHHGTLGSAAYSPDGKYIVTASNDKTTRVWDAQSAVQLAVFPDDNKVWAAGYSPDGLRIITASTDRTARIWAARLSANLNDQILWSKSAEFDPLPTSERLRLGIPADARIKKWPDVGSACNRIAGSIYDPDRVAPGVINPQIGPDSANSVCSQELAGSQNSAQLSYLMGRWLFSQDNAIEAKKQFEHATAGGYRAADVDLATLLLDKSAGMLDSDRAISLYERAWQNRVPIAAFELGRLYEMGAPAAVRSQRIHQPDLAKAWMWYRLGADAGEPNALARLAEREELNALAESTRSKRNTAMLRAFSYYAAAAERAHDEDWPDEAWRNWRYRRATLARLLAREGMMTQVAEAYQTVRDKSVSHTSTTWQTVKSKLDL